MIRENREYRSVAEMKPVDDEKYIVEGYATTFDDAYEMYEYDGVKYYEKISRDALKNADMRDVIFLYNHEGRVLARQKNGTLEVKADTRGIFIRADLSSTIESRSIYEDIKTGLLDQMSWAFTVSSEEYNKDTHTRTITGIKKVYDTSVVSIPANPNTSISARDYFSGVAEMEKTERMNRERNKQLLEIKLKLGV